jgi:ascorbate PTS system EIIA or EIIAB component
LNRLANAFGPDSIEIRSSVSSREEAISISGELLVRSGRARSNYVRSMLQAIEDFGPYIVIAPGIALAHGKPSEDVLETGLSLLALEIPVEFKHSVNDPVRLVFGLAANEHLAHISIMAELAELLSDSEKVNSLLIASNIYEIRAVFTVGY